MDSTDNRTENTLKLSMRDGVYASMMTGFTLDYFTPYLLVLGGAVRHVAVLSALPDLVASIIQIKSADIAERFASRKKVIGICMVLQAAALLSMVFIYFFGSARIYLFIALVTLFVSCSAFLMPVWGSLMSDLVAPDRRGEYFGRRGMLLGFVTVGATFTAGLILQGAERLNVLMGFACVFAMAFVFRLMSWRYMKRMHEPEQTYRKEDYFSIIEFISRLRHSNFARFVVFVSIMKFSVNIASPFFAVLMLKNLEYSYITYTAVTVGSMMAGNLTVRRWGMHADSVGNLKVLKLTARLAALIPVLWMINQNPAYIFIVQAFSGFTWAGFNLSSSNFVYDACTPGKRVRCISYFNAFNGLSLAAGALLGGLLANLIPHLVFDYKVMNIILVSAVLRLVVAFWMPMRLKEVRTVKRVSSVDLFFSMIRRRTVINRADNTKG